MDVAVPGPGADPSAAATSESELRARLRLGQGPIVLSVQAQKVHKNLMRLVQAVCEVAQRHPDVRLVLPGNLTDHGRELPRLGFAADVAHCSRPNSSRAVPLLERRGERLLIVAAG